jgi:hypothetical protein
MFPDAIILAPNRELCDQVHRVAESLLTELGHPVQGTATAIYKLQYAKCKHVHLWLALQQAITTACLVMPAAVSRTSCVACS